VLAAKGELYFAFEHAERFLEVVPVRRGTAAGRDLHVDQGVAAGGVIAGQATFTLRAAPECRRGSGPALT
jgi:hypothetical protein